MEVRQFKTLLAIARMVRHGLGVSVIPVAARAAQIASGVKWVPFGDPPIYRNLVLLQRAHHPKAELVRALCQILARYGPT